MKDLEAIMQSLQRNPEEAKEILRSIRLEAQPEEDQQEQEEPLDEESIKFDDFIKLMQQVENKLARDDPHNLNRQEFIKEAAS